MDDKEFEPNGMDDYTLELLKELFGAPDQSVSKVSSLPEELTDEIGSLIKATENIDLTAPIVHLFMRLKEIKKELNIAPNVFGISRETLVLLAEKHQNLDEHGVTVGGRVNRALPIVEQANERVVYYLKNKDAEAPSGIELWDSIQNNVRRIKSILNIGDDEWNSYSGQLKHCIDSVEKLSKILDLPSQIIEELRRVTQSYRMRLTPYYASLIQPKQKNDPVLLQSVPTGEMVDNIGVEIPPVAADHSPARLIDQFYPRVLTIKATNMCAMYCTHCLRIAHIGKKDRIYSDNAYEEALNYIRNNTNIRDVLVTGGDAFVLPNRMIKKILKALDFDSCS